MRKTLVYAPKILVYVIICGHFVASSYIYLLFFYSQVEHLFSVSVSVDRGEKKVDIEIGTKSGTKSGTGFLRMCHTIALSAIW